MSKFCLKGLTLENGDNLEDVIKKNFLIYRKKNAYSPLYIISNDKEVFEIGYFNDSEYCTYQESSVTPTDISTSFPNEYEKIEDIEQIEYFNMGIYSLVQSMYNECKK